MRSSLLSSDLARRLRPLIYGLIGIVAFVLWLTWVALQLQVSVAGILNAESTWSKAQKQATIDLYAYAVSGDAADLTLFQRGMIIVNSDRLARNALTTSRPDYVLARSALLKGTFLKPAIPGTMFIIHYVGAAPFVRDALQSWRATDPYMDELAAIATRLQHEYAQPQPARALLDREAQRILVINNAVGPLTNVFSRSIALGAAWLASILFWTVVGASALVVLIWLYFARRTLAGIRSSDERYRTLLEGAEDAIVVIDERSGRIVEANRAAIALTGFPQDRLLGADFDGLFAQRTSTRALAELADGPADGAERVMLDAHGNAVPVEVRSSGASLTGNAVRMAVIHDLSERLRLEQERRTAAEALGTIAEGVIIADSAHRVLAVNAACRNISGYSGGEAAGLDFTAWRCLEDGRPLPADLWEAVDRSGHWRGEVWSLRRNGERYPEWLSISAIRDRNGAVQRYVAVFSDISERRRYQQHLEHLAHHDALTGLANRQSFEQHASEAIARAARSGSQLSLLFVDLDGFKAVNDSYGHAFGDRLLAMVAERINSQLREGDFAGRIGGDEFTILLDQVHDREESTQVARNLLLTLGEPYPMLEHEVFLSASIGIAGFPRDGEDVPTLIANADAAMYAAKADERNSFRYYAPVMHASARTRLTLAGELRQALARGEFRLAYQPSVRLDDRRVVAVEALLRWQNAERGSIAPAEFIPLAENLGLIRTIGEWVLDETCRQSRAWLDAGLPPIRIAVNISASHLRHPRFAERVQAALEKHRCPPATLMIEITESAILRIGERTQQTLGALHALGVGVAVDDFGTGYSSLAYLKLPAIRYIKIDQSFVAGIPHDGNDVAITRAILALAASLNLQPIAEGIETEAQRQFLLESGCDEGQGYLFAHPMPAADIERLLERPRVA